MAYGDETAAGGRPHGGLKGGGVQRWTCPDGKWTERRQTPQRWDVAFTSRKVRRTRAPDDLGPEVGSGDHWLIVAHQWVGKMDDTTYATHLEGTKHLLSSRKPGWQGWTTQQRGHTSARLRAIMALEELIAELRDASDEDVEDPRDGQALLDLLDGPPAQRAVAAPGGFVPEPPRAAAVSKRRAATVRGRRQAGDGRPAKRRATTRPHRLSSKARPRARRGAAATARLPRRRR